MIVAPERCITPELAASLTRSLFCGFSPREKRMAIFVSFSDETGVGNPRGKFLVSGYIAREDDWPDIANSWQRMVLDGPPRIPYLHMREIRNESWRKEHGISFEDSQERVSRAVKLLGSLHLDSVASTVARSHLEGIYSHFKNKKSTPVGLDEPDYACFLAYVKFAVEHVRLKYQDVDYIDFVVSVNGKITERIKDFHKQIKLLIDPTLRPFVGDLIPATMETRLPLQCADALCWHMQRFYAGTMHERDRERFDELLGGIDGDLHEWDKSDLENVLANLIESDT